jgi:hypothetical protein
MSSIGIRPSIEIKLLPVQLSNTLISIEHIFSLDMVMNLIRNNGATSLEFVLRFTMICFCNPLDMDPSFNLVLGTSFHGREKI